MAVSAVKTEPAPVEEAAKPAGKKGLIKLIVIALAGAAVVGGGAWWYLGHKGGEPATEAKHEPAKPPVFYPLDTFTVNLMLVDNPQFLQTGITLKVTDTAVADELKSLSPLVRDRILMLMSSRKASDLLTIEGKRQLADEIVNAMNEILGKGEPVAKPAPKAAEAKGAEDKGADVAAAAAADEEEKDTGDAKDGKAAGDGKGGGRPVQAVLFTTFIIQ